MKIIKMDINTKFIIIMIGAYLVGFFVHYFFSQYYKKLNKKDKNKLVSETRELNGWENERVYNRR